METNLNFIIISSRHEQRLLIVKVHTSNWAIVFIELVYERTNTIVPQLNQARVECGEHPWSFGVEGNALDTIRFGLEFGQHFVFVVVTVPGTSERCKIGA